MPHSKTQLPLDQRATQIHVKMEKAIRDLCDATSELLELEDDYDLAEHSISMCEEWFQGMNSALREIEGQVDEAENWMFNGYSLEEMNDEESE